MPWWGWVLIAWAVCSILVWMFIHGASKNNELYDKLAKEHFDREGGAMKR